MLDKVEADLREFRENVTGISNLQERTLNNIGDTRSQEQLEALKARTSQLSASLRSEIKRLQATGSQSKDGVNRAKRAELLKNQFVQALDNYRKVELNFKNAQRNQAERQFRIVKPGATQEEVRAVLDENSDGRIFQQALMNSNELGRARMAYREVQDRHNDIVKIAQTMQELQQLMDDMALKVEEQGEQIDVIEKTAQQVHDDTEKGLVETGKAKTWAQKAREKRVMCFWICVIIILIIALIVGLKVGLANTKH